MPPKPRKIQYKQVEGDPLHLHAYEPAADAPLQPPGAVVFFFGGGWQGGSVDQFRPHAEYLASRGLFACCAEYRTKSTHGASPLQCVEDGKSAVRFLRRFADKLGIHPNRIVAAGGSAGGHVAACTACIEMLDHPDEDADISSEPNALMLFNPVLDTSPEGFGTKYIGSRWKEVSPLHHVRPLLPPTVIFHGDADTTTPIGSVQQFTEAMKAQDNACTLHTYPGETHGFFNRARSESRFRETLGEADRFLVSLGFLPRRPRND